MQFKAPGCFLNMGNDLFLRILSRQVKEVEQGGGGGRGSLGENNQACLN